MKRAVCLWLPNWPLQRLAAVRGELEDRAVVLYELNAAGSAKVAAYCPRLGAAAAAPWAGRRCEQANVPAPGATAGLSGSAARLALASSRTPAGIRAGMPLAEATALAQAGRLHLELVDPAADRLALEELSEWCHQFAPTVGLEESPAPESLLLDASGLAPLFGGETALAERIVRAFCDRGLRVRVAIADTLAAAWAVAHFAELEIRRCHARAGASMLAGAAFSSSSGAVLAALAVPRIVPPGESAAAIAPLPPAALRLPGETTALLAELGLRRIDEVASLRRETLLARFGPLVLVRLDQATGRAAEAIVARPPAPEWLFERLFEHPTARSETIEAVLAELIARACAALARGRRGLLRLECRFAFERRPAERLVAGFYRPTAAPRHVEEVVRLKLERLRLAEPVAAIRLRVLAIDRLEFRQQEFFASEQQRESPGELAALVDRLSNRLGSQAVVRPWLLADAQPEFACQYRPLSRLTARPARKRPPAKRSGQRSAAGAAAVRPAAAIDADRPLCLELEPRRIEVVAVAPDGPPARFRHAGGDEQIVRTWGPERIETGWWRGGCVRRDYYQAETAGGGRYWLFRELDSGRWFLHGKFA